MGLSVALGLITQAPALLLYPDAFLSPFALVYYVVILADILWIFKSGNRQH
jgi:hypothetical protein